MPDCSSLRENIAAKDKEIADLRARVSDLEAKLRAGATGSSQQGAEAQIPPNGTSMRVDPNSIPSIAHPSAVARQLPNGTPVRTEPYNATGRTSAASAGNIAERANAIKEYFLNKSSQKKAGQGGADGNDGKASVANAMVGTDSEDYAMIMNVLGVYVKN